MAHALGISRSDLLLRHMGNPVPETFAGLIERRLAHEPVAYITGQQDFFGLTFRVSPAVLIPRGDSEVLVEAALTAKPDAHRVLDCGTGSGALLLAVLANCPEASGIGIDRSEAAWQVACTNAKTLGLAARAQIVLADWNEPGWAREFPPFDLILANPPYVEDGADLSASVRDHEPSGALFAGPDGLDAYRVLIPQLPALLAPGGIACVEIGASQADAVSTMARAAGLTVRLHHDLGGRARVVELQKVAA